MSGTWSCAGGANAQRAPGPSSTWQLGYKTWFVRQAGLWGSCLEEPQKAEMLWQGSRCRWQQAGSGRSMLEGEEDWAEGSALCWLCGGGGGGRAVKNTRAEHPKG